MSQKISIHASKEGGLLPSSPTPSASQGKQATVAAKQTKPKRPVATKVAPRKVTAKSKTVTQAASKQSSKAATPAKRAQANKTPVKVSKKAVVEIKTEVAIPPKADKVAKLKKPKMVRDSFTIPKEDYALFAVLKQRALTAGVEIKKGELLRAGIVMLNSLGDAAFFKAIDTIERIKTGRPKK